MGYPSFDLVERRQAEAGVIGDHGHLVTTSQKEAPLLQAEMALKLRSLKLRFNFPACRGEPKWNVIHRFKVDEELGG
jgi:hypothetical protein